MNTLLIDLNKDTKFSPETIAAVVPRGAECRFYAVGHCVELDWLRNGARSGITLHNAVQGGSRGAVSGVVTFDTDGRGVGHISPTLLIIGNGCAS